MLSTKIRWLPANLSLKPIKTGDPFQQVRGQQRWAGLMVLEYLAPEMRPASHFLDATLGIELLIASIAIGLKEAGKVLQFGLRMNATPVGGKPLPHQRRACCS